MKYLWIYGICYLKNLKKCTNICPFRLSFKQKSFLDYECQVGILECLFRIIPRKQRREYATKFFHSKDILDQFMQIKDAQFETVCFAYAFDINRRMFNDYLILKCSN